MLTSKERSGRRAAARIVALLTVGAAAVAGGCGASTCERIAADREAFFARAPQAAGPHLEAVLPFDVADGLVAAEIAKVKPIALEIPGLGEVGEYFGKLSVRPSSARLLPAPRGRVRFAIDLEVLQRGDRAFAMRLEVEVEPRVDLEAGRVEIGFTPQMLKEVKPDLSGDAKRRLGGLVYRRIPKLARMLIPRSAVDRAAARAIELLVERFYAKAKHRLLPRLGELTRVVVDLPDLPLEKLELRSFKRGGGGLRLLVTTGLPVGRGIDIGAERSRIGELPRDRVSLRASASALAELVNWAIAEGRVPGRYDRAGEARPDGELRPALAWELGERPMKIVLWDLERPCMRVTMGARPRVERREGELVLGAEGAEIEDVEAAAFTELGVWFCALWKDALDITREAGSRWSFELGGERLVAEVRDAELDGDELRLGVGLAADAGPAVELRPSL